MAPTPQAAAVQARMVFSGVLQVVVGCLAGFLVAAPVAHPRSMLTAHMEFIQNGLLAGLLGLAVPLLEIAPKKMRAMEVLLFFGTWLNGTAFLFSGFSGAFSPLGPLVAAAYPPPVLTDKCVCHYMLLTLAPCLLGGLGLFLFGLWPAVRAAAARAKAA